MSPTKTIRLTVLLLVTFFVTKGFADMEWNVQKTLKIDAPPVDMAVSRDGKRIFVLTEKGSILVYLPTGQLQGSIDVGKHIDQIETGPMEDLLLLKSRRNQTVEILVIDFIHKITTSHSPFKGPAKAPVVITVFNDFQ